MSLGVDGVESTILGPVCRDLVEQTSRPSLVATQQDDGPTMLIDVGLSGCQLVAAVTT